MSRTTRSRSPRQQTVRIVLEQAAGPQNLSQLLYSQKAQAAQGGALPARPRRPF